MGKKQTYRARNFDLRIEDLKWNYSNSNPKHAYTEIKNYMERHGFEHRQYSGYKSLKPMGDVEVEVFFDKMFQELDWLPHCASKIDVTEIGREYDMLDYWNTQSLNVKEQGTKLTEIPQYEKDLKAFRHSKVVHDEQLLDQPDKAVKQPQQITPPKHIR